jgi:hypothetical protein
MVVNGGATAQIFSVDAEQEKNIYIKQLIIVIADASATLNKFGNINALSNGCILRWVTQDAGSVQLGPNLTSNFEIIRAAGFNPAFGDGNGVFKANNVEGASEGYLAVYDFQKSHGYPWGLPLRVGTTDRIEFVIQDNISAIDRLDIQASGIRF